MEKTRLLYNDLMLDEAVSHLLHSRMFEILGYLSMLKEYSSNLPESGKNYLKIAEQLSCNLVSEMHDIIDNYKKENKN